MGIFRSKKDAAAIRDIVDEGHRAQALAAQSTTQFEQRLGMSVQDLTAQAMAMTQGGGMASMQAYAARSARLYQAGVEMPAMLRGVRFGPPNPMMGGIPARVQVTVEPPGAAPYEVDTDQVVSEDLARALVPGTRVTVRVDPADPQSLFVWSTPPAGAPVVGSATGTRAEQLAKLGTLLATGVLTHAEYDAQVAKLPPA
jgi:hypothetical protein